MHSNVLEAMVDVGEWSQEAYLALKFLGEAMISQPTYFSDFMKFSGLQEESSLKIDKTIDLLQKMISTLSKMPLGELFEKSSCFEALCMIIQITSNLYIQQNTKLEIINQIQKYLIGPISSLLNRIIEARKEFIEQVVVSIFETYYDHSTCSLYLIEENLPITSANYLRLKYVLDLESNFLFSLSQVRRSLTPVHEGAACGDH
jgi:hypothetical protein